MRRLLKQILVDPSLILREQKGTKTSWDFEKNNIKKDGGSERKGLQEL